MTTVVTLEVLFFSAGLLGYSPSLINIFIKKNKKRKLEFFTSPEKHLPFSLCLADLLCVLGFSLDWKHSKGKCHEEHEDFWVF